MRTLGGLWGARKVSAESIRIPTQTLTISEFVYMGKLLEALCIHLGTWETLGYFDGDLLILDIR